MPNACHNEAMCSGNNARMGRPRLSRDRLAAVRSQRGCLVVSSFKAASVLRQASADTNDHVARRKQTTLG